MCVWLVSVDTVGTLGLLLSQLRHVNLQAVGQHSTVFLIIDESVFLQILLIVARIGIAFDSRLIVVLALVAIGINVAIGAPALDTYIKEFIIFNVFTHLVTQSVPMSSSLNEPSSFS